LRAIRPVAVAAAALGVLWAAVSGAAAQQGQPILLKPPQRIAPPAAAAPPQPTDAPRPFAGPEAPGDAAATATGVQVDSLTRVDPDTAGTLTRERGGLGADMWAGTDRATVEHLLPGLPVNASSAAMRSLMRRMLLSIARVPAGPTEASLVAIRARLLAGMGDMVGVNTLLNATPGRSKNPELVRVETDARFLANDNARACALAGGQIRDDTDTYWRKAFLFCQALDGEHGKAALGTSLMREAGETDEVFFRLIESLGTGTPAEITSLADPSPLHLAMARVAKVKLPPDVIAANRPGVLRTIAISPNAPQALRLEAAERAEAAGALPVDALRQIYTSVSFSDEQLANPLSRAETEGGPLTRALLYHTSLLQTVPTAQAEVVARALALGREEGVYASVVRVFKPVLLRIPPSAELLWFAPEAVRALLHQREAVAADAWFALMRASALFNKESAQALQSLMPIVNLMGASEAADWTPSQLPQWWSTVKDRAGADIKAALLYTVLDTMGRKVPAGSWRPLIDVKARRSAEFPNVALWFRLIEATESARGASGPATATKVAEATEGSTDAPPRSAGAVDGPVPPEGRLRVAETVLLALLALGEKGPAGADPLVLRQVLISLGAAGFEDEARAMAVEAALAAGL